LLEFICCTPATPSLGDVTYDLMISYIFNGE